jgi:hypothetical protein
MSDEIPQAEQALVDSRNASRIVSNYNPAVEVEHSLVSLLRHRIEKLQEDVAFEQNIKDAIIARLPEAEFSELIRILDTIQANTNVSVEKILSPFIPRVGERVPLLDENRKDRHSTDETIFNEAGKETLQALEELTKVVKLLKERKVENKKTGE